MAELTIGPPATGKRFYNREELIKLIWEKLEVGSILLVAPRLSGATSVMRHLRDKPEQGYHPIFLNVEPLNSPTLFFAKVTAEMIRSLPRFRRALRKIVTLLRHLLRFLRGMISGFEISIGPDGKYTIKFNLREKIEEVREKIEEEWEERAKEWQERAKEEWLKLARNIKGKVVLILDEFPMMVKQMVKGEDKDSVGIFLHWFHSFRQETGNIRFIIGGSVGIGHVLVQAGAGSSMSDMQTIKFWPFSPHVARKLVSELFEGQNKHADGATVEQVLQEVELFMPFFLQLLVFESCKLAKDRGEDVSPSLVSEAYRRMLTDTECRRFFERFYSSLEDYYEANEEHTAKAMFRELALRGEITIQELHLSCSQASQVASDESFSHLLMDLENDFYLQRSGDVYRFHTKILRDWWLSVPGRGGTK